MKRREGRSELNTIWQSESGEEEISRVYYVSSLSMKLLLIPICSTIPFPYRFRTYGNLPDINQVGFKGDARQPKKDTNTMLEVRADEATQAKLSDRVAEDMKKHLQIR